MSWSKVNMRVVALALFAVFTLLLMQQVQAQEARGTIAGKVLDASQAIVPNAAVKIVNTAMGTTVTASTNEAGIYQASYLIPGNYQITVEVSGFKKYIRDGIVLRVNDTLEINLVLEVGAMGEAVTVTAEAPALETSTASMGQVIDSRRIAELPIGHGDPYALIGLAGGVSFTKSARLDRPFEPTHIVGYSMDGTRSNRSDLTIDGASSTATANAGEVISSFVPPQDLVAEFKVQTATFDAQFGNTEGGVTNLSIKSGTNQFHGTGYYTNFTPGTSANDFYANRSNQPLADFYYHRFGGTVGGPVWVPWLYKGTNKTFFMYGMEGIREARPRNNGTLNIPTAKMRAGDFSDFLAIGASYQLYNPFSARRDGSRIRRDPFYCDGTGNPMAVAANGTQAVGTPCNKLPASLINPIAKKFVEGYLPLPTSTATAADGSNNFQQPGLKERAVYYSHTVRIDHVFNEKHRSFGRASWYDRDSDYNNYYNNIATGSLFQFISRQGVFDHVWTMTPTTVWNFRYGYNRFIRVDNTNPGNIGFDLTSLGFPASYANLIDPNIRRFPRFDISGYQGTGFGADFRPNDTHSFNITANKALNTHAIKAGIEFRSYRENSFPTGNNQTGQFNFDNTYVRGPLDNTAAPTQLGFSFASFLLGIPTSGSINQPANYAEQSTTWGLFVHDDWRVNSRLTLNIGLRYEIEGALTERFNRSVRGFDFGYAQPFDAAARAAFIASQSVAANATPEITSFTSLGGLTFSGLNGPRALYEVPKKNFMPRFGLAYKLNDKTVIRAGYGMFFGFLGQRRGDIIQSGYSSSTPLNVTLDNGLTFKETLSNPFSTGLLPIPGNSFGSQTFIGQGVSFFNPRPQSPYMQRWQLGFQRELFGGFVAEASYVGNRGTHIEMTRNINALPNKYLSTSTTRDQTRINYLGALVPNPYFGLMPANAGAAFRSSTIARSQLLRPFPQFGDINTTNNDGYSWYHSFQVNLRKRFSQGFTLDSSYTFSKFMEAVEYLNAGDPLPTEVISSEDRPHRFVISGIYELPFGKGRSFLSNVNKFASVFVSGWQLSGIYSFQSGAPIGFGNVIFTGDVKNIALPDDQKTVTRWINTDAGFNKVAAEQLSGNVRTFPLRFGFIRADKVKNVDLGFIKKTAFGEGKKEFQFRAELLNAFNHPLLTTGGVNVTPTAAAFGQITNGTQDNYPRRVQLTAKFVF